MDPLDRLENLGQFRMKLGLGRIRRLLSEIGEPNRSVPSVHVAGTNGKGSTCHMVHSILSGFPFDIGLYTSPHLIDIEERMRFSGSNVETQVLKDKLTEIFELSEDLFDEDDMPTYFETLTAAFFSISSDLSSDLNIVEVGMGGRFDATNVLEPLATGLTSISLDHQDQLGDEEHLIAREKAGIIKPSTPLVIGPVHAGGNGNFRVVKTILDICTENGSPAVIVTPAEYVDGLKELMDVRAVPDGRLIVVSNSGTDEKGSFVDIEVKRLFPDGPFEEMFEVLDGSVNGIYRTRMMGEGQAFNMAVALCLASLALPGAHSRMRMRMGQQGAIKDLIDGSPEQLFKEYSSDEIGAKFREGLLCADLPGRMEMMEVGNLSILFDGGHNQEAARSLSRTLSGMFPGRKVPFLLAMMKGKEPTSFARELSENVSVVVVTEMDDERSLESGKLAVSLGMELPSDVDVHIRKDTGSAFELLERLAGKEGFGVVSGSFYLYSPLKDHFRKPI